MPDTLMPILDRRRMIVPIRSLARHPSYVHIHPDIAEQTFSQEMLRLNPRDEQAFYRALKRLGINNPENFPRTWILPGYGASIANLGPEHAGFDPWVKEIGSMVNRAATAASRMYRNRGVHVPVSEGYMHLPDSVAYRAFNADLGPAARDAVEKYVRDRYGIPDIARTWHHPGVFSRIYRGERYNPGTWSRMLLDVPGNAERYME